MARVDCRVKGVDLIDHADKTWLREPLVTRPERGLLHSDFSPRGDIRVDLMLQMDRRIRQRLLEATGTETDDVLAVQAKRTWDAEREAWAELRKRDGEGE